MSVLPIHNHLPRGQYASDYPLLDLWLDLITVHTFGFRWESILKILCELVVKPHIAFDLRVSEVLGLRRDAIVCQVHELVMQAAGVVVI